MTEYVVGASARNFHGVPFRVRQVLLAGGVIAYPTEGVYGLGCDARAEQAIQRILEIKDRAITKGLILIAATPAHLIPWLDLPDAQSASDAMFAALAQHPHGRATTWVVPASARCTTALTGGRDTIAVRITRHRDAANLCNAIDGALVSTSANVSGDAAITTPARLRRLFAHQVDAVMARAGGGQRRPSRVIDYATGAVLRD